MCCAICWPALAVYLGRSTQLDDWVNSCITVAISILEKLMKHLWRPENKVERRGYSHQAIHWTIKELRVQGHTAFKADPEPKWSAGSAWRWNMIVSVWRFVVLGEVTWKWDEVMQHPSCLSVYVPPMFWSLSTCTNPQSLSLSNKYIYYRQQKNTSSERIMGLALADSAWRFKLAPVDINRRGVVILFFPSLNCRCFLRCLDENFCKSLAGDIWSW